jgi:FtsZ-interacting cell division protein ZipA
MIDLAITATIVVGVLALAALLSWSSRQSAKERMALLKLRMEAKQHSDAEDLDEMQREVEEAVRLAKQTAAEVRSLGNVEQRMRTLEGLARQAGALK